MAKTELSKKTSEFFVTVSKSGDDWSKELKSAENKLIENTTIKGFRKGKAPREVALKQVSKSDIYSHAIKDNLESIAKEAAKELKDDIMVLDSPTYLVENVDDKGVEIKFVYPIYPEVTIPDYKKLDVKYTEEKVNDKMITDELEKIKDSKVSKEIKSGAIAKGDIVSFDFEGFVDGKPFDGGKAEKYELEIGSGQFIPGFEDKMIGLKKDDKKDLDVKFPDTYQSEELKGKDATFKVVIHEIFNKIKPELNNELIKELKIPNVETLDQLKTYLKDVFKMQLEQQARMTFQRAAFDKLLKDASMVIPASLVAKEMQQMAQQMQADLKKQNMSIEQYMKFTGMNQEAINSQLKEGSEKKLKDAIIFAEIAKIEKIEFKDDDYEKEYKKLAKVYQTSEDGVKNMVTKQQMQVPMTNDRVIDALIKYNK